MTYEPFPAFAEWRVDFDSSVVDAYSERLQRARAASTPEARRRALEIATRYAAVDTGAIEGLYETDRGFTRTIATQSEFWQRALDLKGEKTKRSIQDALNAYEYVLDAVTGNVPLSEKWIRELHAVITEHQESCPVRILIGDRLSREERPLPHGEYKHLPNNPTNRSTGKIHYYAAPEDTAAEMGRFMAELRSDAFLAAHPVVQAAYAHYAYIRVHPFQDGNGRVARALASVYLYRNPGVPLVVFADQRGTYIDSLEAADGGDPNPFIRFVAARVMDTVRSLTDSVAQGQSAQSEAAELGALLGPEPSGLVALAGERLTQACLGYLRDAIREAGLPSQVRVTAQVQPAVDPVVPEGYAAADRGLRLGAVVAVTPFKDIEDTPDWFVVARSVAQTEAPELLVVASDRSAPLEVFLREIDPVETTYLRTRLTAWANRVLTAHLHRLNGTLRQATGE
jgi:Fic family protein